MNTWSRAVSLTLASSCLLLSSVVCGEELVREDIVYVSRDGTEVSYDVIQAAISHGAGVLVMSSGGFFSRKQPIDRLKRRFAFLLDAGYTIVIVRHRNAPEFKVPDAVSDVQHATRHVRLHADEYEIDADRLAAMGYSSGGHLTLMIALDSDGGDAMSDDEVAATSSHVAAAVAYFPPVDLEGMVGPSERFPALEFNPALTKSVSPINFVDAEDPPVLLLHGTEDDVVDLVHSQRMNKALTEAGVVNTLHIFEGAGHGFRSEEHRMRAQGEILAFLNMHLLSN